MAHIMLYMSIGANSAVIDWVVKSYSQIDSNPN